MIGTPLSILWSPKEITYTGKELRPHFLMSEFGTKGSALAAFIGPCHVKTEHLVDLEDHLEGEHIEAQKMLHFMGEFFGISITEGVLLQRLFVAKLAAVLQERFPGVQRTGNDLFVSGQKLSVSIVTSSLHSQLFHLGINIDPTGAPVEAIGLDELGIDPKMLAQSLLESFSEEWKGVSLACTKVRAVIN